MAKTRKQIIGDLGESLVCRYLENKGYSIIDRNYWKPWGEIDIIAKKNRFFSKKEEKLCFIEVKTVTRENIFIDKKDKNNLNDANKEGKITFFSHLKALLGQESFLFVFRETGKKDKNVSYETQKDEKIISQETFDDKDIEYRPENNLHYNKLKRLSRVIMSYLAERHGKESVTRETDWRFDVAIVYLDTKKKESKIKYLKDIIL